MNGLPGLTLRVDEFLSRAVRTWMSRHSLAAPEVLRAAGPKFLHVGCGHAKRSDLPHSLQQPQWCEVRLDVNAAVNPHIVASMLDMPAVPSASMDALYSAHNIEHLYAHQVPVALAEFRRVLKPEGFVLLTCPDLQSLAQLVADDKLDVPAYMSQSGPIAPIDVLYGYRPQLAAGNAYMAHHTGFTLRTLVESFRAAGFASVAGKRRAKSFELWVLACKDERTQSELERLAAEHFPP